MSLTYTIFTPSKAAGFAAAAAIFHSETAPALAMEEERWSGDGFVIERRNDRVVYADAETFCHSGDTATEPPDRKNLRKIFGRGSSPVASCSGNGCYILEKASDSEWLLHLHPAQRFLSDPQRGRQFRQMANRWVSCLKEPPVSQLLEEELVFRFLLAPKWMVTDIAGTTEYPHTSEHTVRLQPGDYRILLK